MTEERLEYDNEFDSRCWPNDYHLDNGEYSNICVYCKNEFIGHKRRGVCRLCDDTDTITPEILSGERDDDEY